jgi:hypothetical protein
MNKNQIEDAIANAQKGIGQYLEIMEMLHTVDVSKNKEFQKKYNAYYRVRQRTEDWYQTYYAFLEQHKNSLISFANTIDYLNATLGRYEPSFSSKLVATINPFKPVWDEHVLNNTGHTAPSYQSPRKLDDAKTAYQSIEQWYIEFLRSDSGRLCVNTFNEKVFRYYQITDLKKVDFILWQIRD